MTRGVQLGIGALVAVVLVVLAVTVAMTRDSTPPDMTATSSAGWRDGEVHGRWTVRHSGYGTVTGSDGEVVLQPRAAADPDTTHAGLVHTTAECRDPSFSLTVHTERHLRAGEPNPWEVAWVLWNFQDDTRFYAVALKPNGWEITKQDPAYPGNQRFLLTGDEPQFPIGSDYHVAITHDGPEMTVTVDGEELATVTDTDSPYREGAIALYVEDARVRFSDFDLPSCHRP